MKKTSVVVPWSKGLHMRPASQVARQAEAFRSSIRLSACGGVADGRSVIGMLLLCATVGTLLDVEVSGGDEAGAVAAVEQIFAVDEDEGGVTAGPRSKRGELRPVAPFEVLSAPNDIQ